jgi:hypothetical protein
MGDIGFGLGIDGALDQWGSQGASRHGAHPVPVRPWGGTHPEAHRGGRTNPAAGRIRHPFPEARL